MKSSMYLYSVDKFGLLVCVFYHLLKCWVNAVTLSTWLGHWLNVVLYKTNVVVYSLACCYISKTVYLQMWPVCLGNSSRYILFHFYTVFNSSDSLYQFIFSRMCSIQFLVSKLVACCIPSKTKESCDGTASQALSLLRMLTVDSDSSMYDYVKVSFWYSTYICCIKDLVLFQSVDIWK